MKFVKTLEIPKRAAGSRKGDNGVVLAVGGSEDYPGAIALAGLAALRSGCDLVRIIAPEKVAWAVNSYSPDLITIKAKGKTLGMDHFSLIDKYSSKSDTILIGNGIGLADSTKKLCKHVAKKNILKVIDADAIKSINMEDAVNSIITPHSKELEYFLTNSDIDKKIILKINDETNIQKKSALIQKNAASFLEKNNVILLKGRIDSIISKERICLVKGGNAGMTKGGTGDVLAGLCAGYLAQSKNPMQSAINASIINKKIGDLLLRKKKGFTYLASDMAAEIEKIQS